MFGYDTFDQLFVGIVQRANAVMCAVPFMQLGDRIDKGFEFFPPRRNFVLMAGPANYLKPQPVWIFEKGRVVLGIVLWMGAGWRCVYACERQLPMGFIHLCRT